MSNKSFSFLTLTYNHEDYIIEHLESIKFLVDNYAQDINVSLVINDDCSKDNTVKLINYWLEKNGDIFSNIVKLFNKENIGTCRSLLNMLDYVDTDAVKLTAGDDVYSFENIFQYAFLPDGCSFLTGIPLDLTEGILSEKKMDTFNAFASQVIYENKPMPDRFKFPSFNNAPNLIYRKDFLLADDIKSTLLDYTIIEDWPLQLAIANKYPTNKMITIPKVFVYYRRTPGSAYIIKKNNFYNDKIKIYEKIIINESSFINKKILENRLLFFKLGNKVLNKIFNISLYIYLLRLIKNHKKIKLITKEYNSKVHTHKEHYYMILLKKENFHNYLKKYHD